ncbi:MAG: methyltransferase [Gracilimonas sp.]
MKKFTHKEIEYRFSRYPETTNRSLRAWSSADEYILLKLEELALESQNIAIYNDRFGFLSCMLHEHQPLVVLGRKSQQRSIEQNLALNNRGAEQITECSPLKELPEKVDIGIINIPKTMDLYRLYLDHVSRSLADDGVVICGFMTKYFSPQMLSIAEEYFEDVDQSLARKKSRLLVLKTKKKVPDKKLMNSILFEFDDEHQEELKQYFGVFSSDNIDYATQFLIRHLEVTESDQKILDLASGNGVIARAIQHKTPSAEFHLTDDSFLAIESSKLNLNSENTHFHWNDTLAEFGNDSFDLVVSNPPFHFGYETNIEVSVKLFREVADILKPEGRFICVANQHLNYKTHLDKLFSSVEVVAQTEKFILYKCQKIPAKAS